MNEESVATGHVTSNTPPKYKIKKKTNRQKPKRIIWSPQFFPSSNASEWMSSLLSLLLQIAAVNEHKASC